MFFSSGFLDREPFGQDGSGVFPKQFMEAASHPWLHSMGLLRCSGQDTGRKAWFFVNQA
jgi:hypothetical protein